MKQYEDANWDELAGAVHEAATELCADGPIPLVELTRQLLDSGALKALVEANHDDECEHLDHDDLVEHLASDVEELLLETNAFFATAGENVAYVPQVLGGATFTHRLTQEELESEVINASIDFAIVDFDLHFDGRILELTSGGSIHTDATSPDSSLNQTFWKGPPGWLQDFAPGDLLVCQRVGGRVRLTKASDTDDAEPAVEALASAFDAFSRDAEEITFLALEALCAAPDVFSGVLVPLSELVEIAGLEIHDVWVGSMNTDWRSPPDEATDRQAKLAAQRWTLSGCCERALEQALDASRPGATAEPRRLHAALAHGDVLLALEYVVDNCSATTGPYQALVHALGETQKDRAAVLLHLRALIDEQKGNLNQAEAFFREAHERDPEGSAATTKLAQFLGDRGDAKEVRRLLSQQGDFSTEHDLVRDLTSEPKGISRNDRCPCGSGRKFKACCQGKGLTSKTHRLQWLRYRAKRHFLDHGGQVQLLALALNAVAVGYSADDIDDKYRTFLLDVALREGGGLQRYVRSRGELFDDVDRGLVQAWLNSVRALYEVTEVEAGVTLKVRNTRNASEHLLVENAASEDLSEGDYFLGCVLNDGASAALLDDPVLVPVPNRAGLLDLLENEPDANDLAEWYASLLGTPTSIDTFEDPFQLLEADIEVSIDDPDLIPITLDECFESDDEDDKWLWLDAANELLARMSVDGNKLHVEANSSEALATLVVELGAAGLDLEVGGVRARSVDDPLART